MRSAVRVFQSPLNLCIVIVYAKMSVSARDPATNQLEEFRKNKGVSRIRMEELQVAYPTSI